MTNIDVRKAYENYCKPKLAQLLACLKLDQVYIRAKGCEVYTDDRREIIDFIGGFGAVLAGHNHPELKKTLVQALDEDMPQQVQVSIRGQSGLLAEKLSRLTPGETGYFTCFTNSGTESVEAVMKHAYKVHFEKVRREYERMCRILNDFYYEALEKHSDLQLPDNKKLIDFRNDLDEYNLGQFEAFQDHPTVVAFKGSFHGKSTSSLKVTFNKSYREGYQGLSAIRSVFIDAGETERIPEIMESNRSLFYYPVILDQKVELRPFAITRVIGLIFEPILGEGGILPLPETSLEALATNHARWGLPYIIDEIQTGSGRTGTFFHYEQTALRRIEPEYLVISKALGGGLVKIGAALVRKDIYDQDFGILHTSTFGEDDLSAAVALRFIGLLEENDGAMLKETTRKGAEILEGLESLRAEFPKLIKEIRGRGLMIAIEFMDLQDNSPFFRLSGKQGILSLLIASYLLEYHGVRLLAPLTTMLKGNPGKVRKAILRVQPPVCVTEEQIRRLIEGLREVLRVIEGNNEYCLISHLFQTPAGERDRRSPRRFENAWPVEDGAGSIDSRTGFIIHPTNLENLETYFFPSFNDYDVDRGRLKDWWNRIARFLEPALVRSDTVRSNDYVLENSLVMVPYLPEYIMADKESFLNQEIRDKIQDAVTVAKELGDENIPQSVVGLGAYSSIATNNGLTLNDHEMSVTTGNAFTVAMTLRGIQKAVSARGLALDQCAVSVVGAGGNIGQAIARVMAPVVGHLILIGSSRATSLRRLEATRSLSGYRFSASG